MFRSLNDISQRAIEHIRLGTTDIGELVTTNAVDSYLDPLLFEQEMAHFQRNRPMAVLAPSQISNPGDYIAKEVGSVPLIIVRGEDGKIRVFLNVCRHRGARLISNGKGQGLQDIACPFHGWSYRSSGELSRIPEVKKCFHSAKMDGHGLVELKAMEFAGMLWVLLDKSSEFPMEQTFANLEQEFAVLGFEPRFPLSEFVHVGNFNWKIGVEAFLEVDHFPFAHAPYLTNIQFPSLSLVDSVGENYRIVVPLKEPQKDEFVLKWAQVMYFLFPSTFLLFYSDHVALLYMTPLSVEKTEFRYIPLVPQVEDLDNLKIKEKAEFLKVIIQQDFEILEGIQSGLKSGANSHFTFTRTEQVLGQFHKNLAELRAVQK
jgi:phenylpropionate dioxygenase-like ring-hydroxylating dioxygenase large terminal subunit